MFTDIINTPSNKSLLRFYLRNRQQYVRLGIYESKPYHTRSGVSQGSILGPLLFLVMINDLPAVVTHSKCLLYADDLKLFRDIKCEADCEALQRDVDSILTWSNLNKMEFNIEKCYMMTFCRLRHPIRFAYKINNMLITRSHTIKDLGVLFDPKLTFHDHVVALAKESHKRLGFVLRSAREFRCANVIRLIYSALVRTKLETSACVWNPHESTYALLLEKVQKVFLRYLYKRTYGRYPYLYPTKFLLGTLNYNSLEVRRKYIQLTTACKIFHGKIDASDLSNELCSLRLPHKLPMRTCRKLQLFAVPPAHTVARANSPIPRMLSALNALLVAYPECDLFADEWSNILLACQKFCEREV